MIHSEPDKCLVATLKSQGSSSISSKLIKSNNCHEDQQTCSNQYYERSCLSSSTSSFQTLLDPSTLPSFYTSLLCCFRCCFEYFLDFAKVADNKIEISSNQQQDKQTNFYIEKPSYRTLTFGLSSLLSISSYIITDHTILGNIPVMHITTVTTLQRQYWMNIKGRRIMLFTHIPHCVPTPHVQGISSSMSHFGNPTVATWYTTQLPCDLVISSTIINSHFSPNTDSRRTQPTTDGSGMSEKLQKKLFSNTLASPTLPWMNLIPIGVRDPKLFDSIVYKLTDSGSNSAGSKSSSGSSGSNNWFSSSSSSSSKVRSILLDTTCAQAHTESLLSTMTNSDKNSNILRKTIESLQHMLSQLNSNGFTVHINRSSTIRSSSSSSKSHSDINKSLSEYYQNLLLIKFVLSPSLPTSLSHCEWEALAAGAIPIVDAATITHPSIRALYEGLPVLYINSWSEVTFSYLQSQYDLLTSSSSDSVSMSKSIEKIYFPYWLDKLTKHLISGKAPARFFTNVTDGLISASTTASSLVCTSTPTKPFKLEIILPRCCEDGIETAWIEPLLAHTRSVHVSVHYKCPSCLPRSKSNEWLSTKLKSNKDLNRHYTKGISLLDDTSWLPHEQSGRLRQVTSFDTIYNGKEVTAYLHHIIDNYDNLADQTVFLHSVPNAHIYFKLFFRLLQYAETCQVAVPFIHLNVNYKSELWGDCCGRDRACQLSTWQYLFGSNSKGSSSVSSDILSRNPNPQPFKYPSRGSIGTYSSAQFTASRDSIHRWPKSFWTKMLLAINGTHNLAGCAANSEPGKSWGGHHLTGQYERLWHIIFGHLYMQVSRRQDLTLPEYLRKDCGPNSCVGAV